MTAIIVTLALAALGWLIYLFWTAPIGYEDENGWHEGEEP